MDVGLCMVVKDEARQIVDCLKPIHDLFAQTVVVDTGSTDATPELLAEHFGISVLHRTISEARCGCLCDARNDALALMETPWVMFLDADERLARSGAEQVLAMAEDPSQAGYFGQWVNHIPGEPSFEDYKLFLFRSNLRLVGLVHDVVQTDVRARGLSAAWLPSLSVMHFPDPQRRVSKAARYRQRLRCAIAQDPHFHRYHWFLGYTEFLVGNWHDAEQQLGVAADACSTRFPVECLNSAMVLAELHARAGEHSALERTLARAIDFHDEVAGDFEVAINFRLGPWLRGAWQSCHDGRLSEIRAYRFAC